MFHVSIKTLLQGAGARSGTLLEIVYPSKGRAVFGLRDELFHNKHGNKFDLDSDSSQVDDYQSTE